MKAFLASAAETLQLLAPLAQIQPKQTTVAFVANAADLYGGLAHWVEADRQKFQELGFHLVDIDLRQLSKAELRERLDAVQIIHICGGNLLYLLSLLQEKDIIEVIREAVIKGGKIYTGTSAGSMIAAQSVELEKYSTESTPEVIAKLKNYDGLGLVDFLLVPHSGNPDFVPDTTQYVQHLHKYDQPVIFVYDHQALWVTDGSVRLVVASY